MGGGYVGNAGTKHPEAVLAFFDSFLSPEVGNRWLDNVMVQTGIVSDPSKISRRQASDYFQMIAQTNAGSKYFFGIPIQVMQGKAKEVFIQVINNAFPAGNISVEDAVEQMKSSVLRTDPRSRGSVLREGATGRASAPGKPPNHDFGLPGADRPDQLERRDRDSGPSHLRRDHFVHVASQGPLSGGHAQP